jgi:hypothetical protein
LPEKKVIVAGEKVGILPRFQIEVPPIRLDLFGQGGFAALAGTDQDHCRKIPK